MKVRDIAIIAVAAATDLEAYEGYGVIADATLPGGDTGPAGVKIATAADGACVGVITTAADGTKDNLSIAAKGFGGTARFKLGGAVSAFDKLTLMADGTFEGNGAGTVVGMAIESGAIGELVEGTFRDA